MVLPIRIGPKISQINEEPMNRKLRDCYLAAVTFHRFLTLASSSRQKRELFSASKLQEETNHIQEVKNDSTDSTLPGALPLIVKGGFILL